MFLGTINITLNPLKLRHSHCEAGSKCRRILGHLRLLNQDLRVEPQGISCPLPSSPGAVPAAATDKINKKVIFKLPRGAAVPLWVYLKSSGQLQYIITNQQEGGRKGSKREGGGEVVRSITDCFCETLTVRDGRGCRQVKDAPHGDREGDGKHQESVLSRGREGT